MLQAAAEDCLKEAEAQFKTANEKRSNLLEKLAEETRSDKEAGLEEREVRPARTPSNSKRHYMHS